MAQLERDIIAERVKAGLRRAKECGKQIGRQCVDFDPAQVRALRRQGMSLRAIAEVIGISHTHVANVLKSDL